MSLTYKFLLILSSTPVMIFALQMIISRLNRKSSPQMNAFISILVSSLPMAVLLWMCVFSARLNSQYFVSELLYAGIVFSSLGYTYFHLFNMSETARRVRIFCEIYEAGSLSEKDIYALYDTGDLLERRVERLAQLNQILKSGELYRVSGKVLLAGARVVKIWGILLGFPPLDQLKKAPQR